MEPHHVERPIRDDRRQPHHPQDAARHIVPPILRSRHKGHPRCLPATLEADRPPGNSRAARRPPPLWKLTGRQATAELLAAHPEERLCASAIVYSSRRREIWLVGDCQCLVGGELCENPKPYEATLAERRAEKVRELLAAGMTPDEILADDQARAAIIPEMLRAMQQQNKTYAVIDGFPIPEARVPIITLDFRPWEIVLASDGYPFLCPTLAESESRLDEQRRNDPLNIGRFKATKGFTPGNNSFDDRTYIRFMV